MTFTATTALPYPHLERATAAMRAELRHRLADGGVREAPDWTRLAVEGPVEFTDNNGNTWFGYRATLETSQST